MVCGKMTTLFVLVAIAACASAGGLLGYGGLGYGGLGYGGLAYGGHGYGHGYGYGGYGHGVSYQGIPHGYGTTQFHGFVPHVASHGLAIAHGGYYKK